MIDYHEGLRKLVDDTLNANPYGIIFDVALYKSDDDNYYQDVDDEVGYGVTRKQVVPVVIPSIIGSYINIPNISVTDNTIGLEFDLFLGDYQDLDLKMQDRFQSVDYNSTLLSVDYLTKQLLAQYHPLGTKNLYMGGQDSNATVTFTSALNAEFIYLKFTPKDDETENIIGNATKDDIISKTSTNIVFSLSGTNGLSIPYTVNQEIELLYYYDSTITDWRAINITTGDGYTLSFNDSTLYDLSTLKIGATTGFYGIIDTIAIDNVSSSTYTQGSGYSIELYDFDSKDKFTNNGENTISTTNAINNSILWGSSGNAIFGFETLYPVSDIRYFEGMPYQRYRTDISALVSNDVLFGNNVEYYLTNGGVETQIYPIDRNHAYAGVANTAQKIMDKYGTTIIDENAKELTHTFFYNGDRKLTEMLRQVTRNTEEQNKEYTLRVQYPFYSEDYSVLIDTGGTSPNLNSLFTFSVTYKQRDTNLG